jgi:hypothetical protein
MKLSNIATVLVRGRKELHLKFNNDSDLRDAYVEITKRMEGQQAVAAPVEAASHYDWDDPAYTGPANWDVWDRPIAPTPAEPATSSTWQNDPDRWKYPMKTVPAEPAQQDPKPTDTDVESYAWEFGMIQPNEKAAFRKGYRMAQRATAEPARWLQAAPQSPSMQQAEPAQWATVNGDPVKLQFHKPDTTESIPADELFAMARDNSFPRAATEPPEGEAERQMDLPSDCEVHAFNCGWRSALAADQKGETL